MKTLFFFFCLFLLPVVFGGIFEDLTYPLVHEYEKCKMIGNNRVVLFWNITATEISLAVAGRTTGFVAFGFSRIIGTGMNDSDAIVGWFDGAPTVTDLYITRKPPGDIVCDGLLRGVCSDIALGGSSDIAEFTVSQNDTSGITTMRGTRLLNTGDIWDVPVTNATAEFIYSLGSNDFLSFHDITYSPFNLNLYDDVPCRVGANSLVCSGNGDCHGGCCVCNGTFIGADCSVDTSPPTETNLPATSEDIGVPSEIDPDRYEFNFEFDDIFTAYWIIEDDEIEIALDCQVDGWVGFGISKDGKMVDSDAVIGWFDEDNLLFIDDYYITAREGSCKSTGGVCADSSSDVGGTNDILEFNGNHESGRTQIIFRRKLDTGDSEGDISIENKVLNVIWAFNTADNDGFPLLKHLKRGSAKMNFFTGAAEETTDLLPSVHGVMMFIAWSILIPGSSWLARYWKKYTWWFHVHRIVNTLAILLTVVGFIIAVVMTEEHFSEAHMIIGLIITILTLIQPFIGLIADRIYGKYLAQTGEPFRPADKTPFWPDKVHWIIGWGTLLLAMINVLLGIILNNSGKGYIVFYVIFGSLIIGFLLFWAIVDLIMKKKNDSSGH